MLGTGPAFIRLSTIAAIGVLTGLVTVVLCEVASPIVVGLLGVVVLLFLPSFVVRDVTTYWLWGYLFFLPFEFGKRITNRGLDVQDAVNTIGLPPSTYFGIKIGVTDVVLAGLVVVWLMSVKRGVFKIHLPKATYVLAAFLLWFTAVSIVKASHPSLSLAELTQSYKYLIVFLLFTSTLDSRERVRTVTAILVSALAMEVVVTLVLSSMGYNRDSLVDALHIGVSHEFEFLREEEQAIRLGGTGPGFRAAGTFGAPSHLSMYLMLSIPLSVVLFATARNAGRRLLYGALFLGATASLLLTVSRAGLLGFMTGVGVCVILLKLRGWISVRSFLLLIYAGAVLVVLQGPSLYHEFSKRPETFWHRLTLVQEGVQLFLRNPVLGVGANNSTVARVEYAAAQPYAPLSPGSVSSFDNLYPIHNQFIVLVVESGTVGFVLFAVFTFLVLRTALRLSRSHDPLTSALSIAVIGAYVGLGTQLMGDHFVGNAQHTMFWLLSALVFALERIESAADVGDAHPPAEPSYRAPA